MRLFSNVRKHLMPVRFGFVAADPACGPYHHTPDGGHASRAPFYLVGGIALGLVLIAAAPHRATDDGNRDQLLQQAGAGAPEAELQLGLAYRDGRYGLPRDPRAAAGWLTRAAQSGDGYAAALLGDAYAQGQGVARNEGAAERWWHQAALADDVHAQAQLGQALMNGSGSSARHDEGRHWLERAAAGGDVQARHALGIEVPTTAAVADRIDRDLGVTQGHGLLGDLYRLVLGKVSGSASIDGLKHRALAGDDVAQYQLAMRYRDGSWGVEADPKLALGWLRQAADHGNPVAMATLAEAYRKGELGLAPDPVQASAWQQRAGRP
jgi:uncharacterized protein